MTSVIQALEIRVHRFIKKQFPDGDTQAIVTALRDILHGTDQGRTYRRQILSCYSQTNQAEIQPEFQVAVGNVLAQHLNKTQMTLLGKEVSA